jgi:hypothetical protein
VAEHTIGNGGVGGSIPLGGTIPEGYKILAKEIENFLQ